MTSFQLVIIVLTGFSAVFWLLELVVALSTNIIVSQFINRPLLPAFFLPVGNIIMFLVTIKAAVITSIKRGITWRGTFYSKQTLKKGRRLTF